MKRPSLPVDQALPQILSSLERNPSLVVQAAPGTGKTTRIPPALLEASFRRENRGEILVLEPRRLAAKMAARRVAQERGEQVGQTIGYQFRFENVSSAATRVRFLTEGMLMRRLLGDPSLQGVSAVILDEFHERHLHGDVALAFLRKLQSHDRPELRVVVMSATLDTAAVAGALGGCPVIQVPGKQYEVEIDWLAKPSQLPLEQSVKQAVAHALSTRSAGADRHMLVFLPGMAEIRRSAAALAELARDEDLLVLPLHGDLSREEQDLAVSPSERTKVILSTNVAETSLTIEGVNTVIDSGLVRSASYSWWSGLPLLRTKSISRASAIQRAGRAGRTAPGRCYRLYTKGDFEGRAPFEVPEIQRADLSQTVLELKALNVRDTRSFPWFEKPSEQSLEAAEKLLHQLGAVDGEGALTALGRRMVEMPTHPRLARLVLEAESRGCLQEGARLAALLSEIRLEGPDLFASLGRTRLDGNVSRMQERLVSAAGGSGRKVGANVEQALHLALLRAFPDRVAKKRVMGSQHRRGQYELVFSSGGSAVILQDSPLIASHEYFVAVDVEERGSSSGSGGQALVRLLAAIEPEWLFDLEPVGVEEREELSWNADSQRVEALSQLRYGQLVLSESRQPPRDRTAAGRILAGRVGDWSQVCDAEELLQLQNRLELLNAHRPDLELPVWTEESLREKLASFCSDKISLREVKEGDFLNWLLYQLTPGQQQALDRLTPLHVELAQRRRVKVNYESGKPPWIASRLQDFFGMKQGPAVLGGKAPLALHLLAPNQRAVQITTDLSGFWERHYPQIRKELGRRYPRHKWPENPLAPGS